MTGIDWDKYPWPEDVAREREQLIAEQRELHQRLARLVVQRVELDEQIEEATANLRRFKEENRPERSFGGDQ